MIDQVELLPRLDGKVVLPDVVRDEWSAPHTPAEVPCCLASSPPWLDAGSATAADKLRSRKLDRGERAAIALAMELGASVILMEVRLQITNFRYSPALLETLQAAWRRDRGT